jgi:hypothetical protein
MYYTRKVIMADMVAILGDVGKRKRKFYNFLQFVVFDERLSYH